MKDVLEERRGVVWDGTQRFVYQQWSELPNGKLRFFPLWSLWLGGGGGGGGQLLRLSAVLIHPWVARV